MVSHPASTSRVDELRPLLYTSEPVHRRWLSTKAFEISLSRPAGFDFQAGQGICIVYEGHIRHYSLTNAPAEPVLSLCVRHIREGLFTPVLAEADLGTRFEYTGPHGYFLFRPSQRQPCLSPPARVLPPFWPCSVRG